jgi:hypothetical protein
VKARYIVALVLALTATQADAKTIATTPNIGNGLIVFTDAQIPACNGNYAVYSTSPVANTLWSCWWTDGTMMHVSWPHPDGTSSQRSYRIDSLDWVAQGTGT